MNIQGLFGYRLQYEGGLPDITNPCKVIVRFKDDQAIITFLDIRYLGKKVLIKPQDIVELSEDSEHVRSAGRIAGGVLTGGCLLGPLGWLLGGALGAKRKRVHDIKLIVIYKGEPTRIYFTPSVDALALYHQFKRLK
ncbi:MAG: hypothetical protein H6606_05960 [Flavobacteriales bacterium]|nr:hypothetical protein [Flavobacteriales bacterium]